MTFVNDNRPGKALPFHTREEAEAFLKKVAGYDNISVKRSEWSIISFDVPFETLQADSQPINPRKIKSAIHRGEIT